jgi:hypothetical protein
MRQPAGAGGSANSHADFGEFACRLAERDGTGRLG